MIDPTHKIHLITDGACSGNPGAGGFGIIIKSQNNYQELYGYEPHTTNNKMELMGVIEGLRALSSQKATPLVIVTDSKYVLQGATEWMPNWIRKNWRTASNEPVKNIELWQMLNELLKGFTDIEWRWVKGHSGDPDNERVDTLARNAIVTKSTNIKRQTQGVIKQTRQIIFDTETTGLNPQEGDRIVEIGCVELVNRVKTGNNFHIYLNPERDMPEVAFNIHGLSSEFLSDKALFGDICDEFLVYIKDAELIAHNASFDVKFLDFECVKAGKSPISGHFKVIDTYQMAKLSRPGQKNSLNALCKHYNIDISKRVFHGALLDAELLADVYLAMTSGQFDLKFNQSSLGKGLNENEVNYTFDNSDILVVHANSEEIEAHVSFLEKFKI